LDGAGFSANSGCRIDEHDLTLGRNDGRKKRLGDLKRRSHVDPILAIERFERCRRERLLVDCACAVHEHIDRLKFRTDLLAEAVYLVIALEIHGEAHRAIGPRLLTHKRVEAVLAATHDVQLGPPGVKRSSDRPANSTGSADDEGNLTLER